MKIICFVDKMTTQKKSLKVARKLPFAKFPLG